MKVLLGQETHTIKTPVVAFTLTVDEARALVGALDEWNMHDGAPSSLIDEDVVRVEELNSKLAATLGAHDTEVRDRAMGET